MNKKRTQPVRITLPPGDGITGKSSNSYQEYKRLRKHSPDFNTWVKRTYGKQGAKCYYCRTSLVNRRINVEHVTPLSRGGQTSSRNMVISCAPCNKDKGSKFLAFAYPVENEKQIKDILNHLKKPKRPLLLLSMVHLTPPFPTQFSS